MITVERNPMQILLMCDKHYIFIHICIKIITKELQEGKYLVFCGEWMHGMGWQGAVRGTAVVHL